MIGPTITVTKLDVARSQLNTAIQLWFEGADPISIHTLVAAAHEIIHSLFKRKGLSGLFFDSPLIRDEFRSKLVSHLKKYANFFKHADRDANNTMEFNPESSEALFIYCIIGLVAMKEVLTWREAAFYGWTMVARPELFSAEKLANFIPEWARQIPAEMTRNEFFDTVQLLHRQGGLS
jgi:hypothetical protein